MRIPSPPIRTVNGAPPQRNIPHSLRPEHTLPSMALTAAAFTREILRTDFGHTATQAMHEMHLASSTRFGSAASIAPAGQRRAHAPHPSHAREGNGTSPTRFDSR